MCLVALGACCFLIFSSGVLTIRADFYKFSIPDKHREVQFESVYDDRKGKMKASNVTGGSGGTMAGTGKGGKYNTSGKGGGDEGRRKGSFKGDTRAGMGGKGMRMFIETNREIQAAAWSATEFAALLARICSEKRPLNGVNISTILHRSSKKRYRVDPLALASF